MLPSHSFCLKAFADNYVFSVTTQTSQDGRTRVKFELGVQIRTQWKFVSVSQHRLLETQATEASLRRETTLSPTLSQETTLGLDSGENTQSGDDARS